MRLAEESKSSDYESRRENIFALLNRAEEMFIKGERTGHKAEQQEPLSRFEFMDYTWNENKHSGQEASSLGKKHPEHQLQT